MITQQLLATANPRDLFIPVFGRKPVLEALADRSLEIDKVLVAHAAKGDGVEEILALARERKITLRRVAYPEVVRISKSPSQDQGVVADVRAPLMEAAESFFAKASPEKSLRLLALDGITTPANVGMCIRSAAAAGMDGVVLPRHGTSGINPLVIKASAGTVFRVPLLRCEHLAECVMLAKEAGLTILGLDAGANAPLFEIELPHRALYIVGNESVGLSNDIRTMLDGTVQIPMAGTVESLNVAVAASLLCFETMRRMGKEGT